MDETTVINTLQRRGLYLHVFSSDHIKQMCTDKYGLSLQTSFILESVCNYDDIRCQVMERGGLQFLIAATKEIPHFPFSKRQFNLQSSCSAGACFHQQHRSSFEVHILRNVCVTGSHTLSHIHTGGCDNCICISETRFWHFSVLNMQYLCILFTNMAFLVFCETFIKLCICIYTERRLLNHIFFFMRLLHLSDCQFVI